jgi:hypothetical protein
MKNIHTFEEFVNEAINEAKTSARTSIPSRVSTVVNKIKKGDPWSRGEKIANMIETNWDDIVATAKENPNRGNFMSALYKKDYVIALAKELYLAIDHFIGTIVKSYF